MKAFSSQVRLEIWACSLLACVSQEKWTKSYFGIILPCTVPFSMLFSGEPCEQSVQVKSSMKLPISLPYCPDHSAGPVRGAVLQLHSPNNSQTATSVCCVLHLLLFLRPQLVYFHFPCISHLSFSTACFASLLKNAFVSLKNKKSKTDIAFYFPILLSIQTRLNSFLACLSLFSLIPQPLKNHIVVEVTNVAKFNGVLFLLW